MLKPYCKFLCSYVLSKVLMKKTFIRPRFAIHKTYVHTQILQDGNLLLKFVLVPFLYKYRSFSSDEMTPNKLCFVNVTKNYLYLVLNNFTEFLKENTVTNQQSFCVHRITAPEGLFLGTTSSVVNFVNDFNKFFKCPSKNGKCKGINASSCTPY